MIPRNLYVHFPFCRRKCTYCALYSRAGISQSDRDDYVRQLAQTLRTLGTDPFDTIYFGGGSPALCDLSPVFESLTHLTTKVEFTVELHPLDVSSELLSRLIDGGVNRISMGVQSLDDATLMKMGRGYTVAEARHAFQLIRRYFDNAGIDLIIGYPGDSSANWSQLREWGLQHCSVYSLIIEDKTILSKQLKLIDGACPQMPDDNKVLDKIQEIQRCLAEIGLIRYEISNYARSGYECRHNLAVWRGEDYLGLGIGAFGRIGLKRTQNFLLNSWGQTPPRWSLSPTSETVSQEQDLKERTIFRLRTNEGLDTTMFPDWRNALDRNVEAGLLKRLGNVYFLTERGTEVCDTILAEIV